MRARNLRKAGRAEEAINEYMISARLRPNEPDAYLEMGNTYIGLGREEEGIAQIRAALEAEPENPTALSILTFQAITRSGEDESRRWMTRVANQPRVKNETLAALARAYREKFGRNWR
jgi:tetratricopeptide (TPR) repeat protein